MQLPSFCRAASAVCKSKPMELALQPRLSPQGDPAAPQTCHCQSVQLQGCFQRLCRKVALQLWAPVVASALLQLGSLQLHKALLLSGAAGGMCVCSCQEKWVSVLLQLQDVLQCDCSCSAHVQLFLSRPPCSTVAGCPAHLTFRSEVIYLKDSGPC